MAPTAPPGVSNSFSYCGKTFCHACPVLIELQLWTAIELIHYASPGVFFIYFVLALMVTVCTLQTKRLRVQDQQVRRDIILGFIFGVSLSYVSLYQREGASSAVGNY